MGEVCCYVGRWRLPSYPSWPNPIGVSASKPLREVKACRPEPQRRSAKGLLLVLEGRSIA